MSKMKLPIVSLFVLFSLMVSSCTPGISIEEYEAVKAELDKANAELAQTKTDLDKANDDLTQVKAALAEANAALAKGQPAYFEELLRTRRSVREYTSSPLSKDEVLKLLWAGQGLTAAPKRTAPSANPENPPVRLYLVVGNVENLAPGVYKYVPANNDLTQARGGDLRDKLFIASSVPGYSQVWVKEAAIDIVVAAVYKETVEKFTPLFGEERGKRYVLLEAGHAAQNILLMATALGLGALPVGGFNDGEVKNIVGLLGDENPVYIIPVGRKK